MFKPTASVLAVALMLTTGAAAAHDLFVSFAKPTVSKSQPNTARIINGTFGESAGALPADRLRDASLHEAGARSTLDVASWKALDKHSEVTVRPDKNGTFLLGVSTMMSKSTRSAAEFAEYLELEDLPDTLATYDAAKYPNGVTYGYTKHARAIGQVGTVLTDDYAASLGYPLEIRLSRNPGAVKVGEQLVFEVLHDGKPVPDLRLHVGTRAAASGKQMRGTTLALRTDASGRASIRIDAAGTWYIHTNRMVPSKQSGLDFVSDRASLTFEIVASDAKR